MFAHSFDTGMNKALLWKSKFMQEREISSVLKKQDLIHGDRYEPLSSVHPTKTVRSQTGMLPSNPILRDPPHPPTYGGRNSSDQSRFQHSFKFQNLALRRKDQKHHHPHNGQPRSCPMGWGVKGYQRSALVLSLCCTDCRECSSWKPEHAQASTQRVVGLPLTGRYFPRATHGVGEGAHTDGARRQRW